MTQHELPHFEHHRRELQVNRQRFSVLLLVLIMGVSVVLGLQFRSGSAATNATIKGKAYNKDTGAGIAGLTLALCNGNGTVVTNSTGGFAFTLPQWSWFCVAYQSGAPANVTYYDSPNMTSEAKAAGQKNYQSQVAGINCYHNTGCNQNARLYDRSVDTGYDLRFLVKATPAPTKTPTPTPKTPTPSPKTATPKPPTPPPTVTVKPQTTTPKPTTPKPRPTTGGGSGSGSGSGGTVDTSPPAAPGAFQALASSTNAVIDLSWQVPAGATDVTGYQLERSLNQSDWSRVGGDLVALAYTDDSVAFSAHYFYRLRAVDGAGNGSDYALADAATPTFSDNTHDSDTTYMSDDQVVSVLVPQGALADEAQCSVAKDSRQDLGSKDRPLLAGAYVFLCKTGEGDVVSTFSKPLTWIYQLKSIIKNLKKPAVFVSGENGDHGEVKGAVYNAKTGELTFKLATGQPTYILAYAAKPLPLELIAVILLVLGIIAGVVVVILRRKQRTNYDDYLRSKYYNL